MKVEELKKLLDPHKKEIEKEYKVKEIGFFGSYVRNEQKRGSDLDVLIEFSDPPGFFKLIKLEDYLTKILGVKVDLVRKKALRTELKEDILKEVMYV